MNDEQSWPIQTQSDHDGQVMWKSIMMERCMNELSKKIDGPRPFIAHGQRPALARPPVRRSNYLAIQFAQPRARSWRAPERWARPSMGCNGVADHLCDRGGKQLTAFGAVSRRLRSDRAGCRDFLTIFGQERRWFGSADCSPWIKWRRFDAPYVRY
jgi:hypothetical protein